MFFNLSLSFDLLALIVKSSSADDEIKVLVKEEENIEE